MDITLLLETVPVEIWIQYIFKNISNCDVNVLVYVFRQINKHFRVIFTPYISNIPLINKMKILLDLFRNNDDILRSVFQSDYIFPGTHTKANYFADYRLTFLYLIIQRQPQSKIAKIFNPIFIIKFHKYGIIDKTIFSNLFTALAKDGDLLNLKWLYRFYRATSKNPGKKYDCPWTITTCSMAAKYGHLLVLKWLRKKRCRWNSKTCAMAALNGHSDILIWACTNGCTLNDGDQRNDRVRTNAKIYMDKTGDDKIYTFVDIKIHECLARQLSKQCTKNFWECTIRYGKCPHSINYHYNILN